MAWWMAICGVGFGFFQSPNNRTILASVPPDRAGSANGILATARLVGQTFGAALVGLIFALTSTSPSGISHGATLALLVHHAVSEMFSLRGRIDRSAFI